MAYKFNPFTGTLDYYQAGSSQGVTGVAPTDINAIARWANTGATVIANSPGTYVQDSGAIQAQGFITNRVVTGVMDVPSNHTLITDSLEMQPGSMITMHPGSKIIIS